MARRPDEAKRRELLAVAARLFASRPFHEVRLEDVVAEARVSKGTVYTYFESKEDLFLSIIRDGVADVVERLRARARDDDGPVLAVLGDVIDELAGFCVAQAAVIRLLRQGVTDKEGLRPQATALRGELEALLRRGVDRGEVVGCDPPLVSLMILGAIAEPVVWPGPVPDLAALRRQLRRQLLDGLRPRPGAAADRAPAARRRPRA